MRTIVVLFALVACAFAQFGRGGQFPQSCKTAAENSKQCFTTNLQSKGITIKIEEIKKCFESCPHTQGEGKGEGRGKGEHAKSKDSSPNDGNWAKAKEAFKTFRECMDGKIGDKQEQCVAGKITYVVAAAPKEAKGSPGGPGGRHAKGGFRGGFRGGNPLKTLKEKADKCGAETTACLREKMGEWFDKTDELSQILCDASKACPHTKSDTCKADLKAGRDARCACKAQLSAEVTAAKTECAAGAGDALDRVSKRAGKGKGEHKDGCDGDDDSSEENDDNDKHDRNPFCEA